MIMEMMEMMVMMMMKAGPDEGKRLASWTPDVNPWPPNPLQPPLSLPRIWSNDEDQYENDDHIVADENDDDNQISMMTCMTLQWEGECQSSKKFAGSKSCIGSTDSERNKHMHHPDPQMFSSQQCLWSIWPKTAQ